MRTRTRSRLSGATAAATLAMVLGAPSLVQAQQSGLFPLAPIRRERVPCAVEDPVYKLYRQEYFGYHPTCWRRFPTGWGCPSPEAPNAAESFRLLPREDPDQGYGPDEEGQPGPDMGPGTDRPGGDLPGGRNTQPPANNLPPLPSGERSPFDLDPKPQTPPAGAGATPTELPGAGGPSEASEPVSQLPQDRLSDPAEAPTLALPDPTVSPTSSDSVESRPSRVRAESAFPEPAENTTPIFSKPTRAPRRQGFLSRLFNGRTVRR